MAAGESVVAMDESDGGEGEAGEMPVAVAHACDDVVGVQEMRWAAVRRPVTRPPELGSATSVWCTVTGDAARETWRAALAAPTGARRRVAGIALAVSERGAAVAMGGAEGGERRGGGRPRGPARRPAGALGTAVATQRVEQHLTQPPLWEPGVT